MKFGLREREEKKLGRKEREGKMLEDEGEKKEKERPGGGGTKGTEV